MVDTASVRSGDSRRPGRLELDSGVLTRTAAVHLAVLTAQAAQASTAMIHLVEGEQLRLVAGSGLPVPLPVLLPSTLGALVIAAGAPVVITDVTTDERVPRNASGGAAGGHAYA